MSSNKAHHGRRLKGYLPNPYYFLSIRERGTVFILILMISVLLLACIPCGLGSRDTDLPGGPVDISDEAAERLERKLTEALQENPSERFILHITDEEATSYAARGFTSEEGSPVTDPQIRFTQGKIFMAGTLTGVCPVRVRALFVASAQIVNNRFQIKVEEARLGPMPMPEGLLKPISQSLNETLADAQFEIEITEVQILEGEMIVAGRK